MEEKKIKTNSNEETNTSWQPTFKWLAKVSGVIFIFLVLVFVIFNIWLSPYMREINPALTPWLDKPQTLRYILGSIIFIAIAFLILKELKKYLKNKKNNEN